MNIIKLKRGRHENLPVLAVGEPAFTTDTKELYIGTATGNVKISADIDEINTILANYVTNGTFNALENRVSNVETNKVSTSTLNQQLLLKQETKPNGVDSLVLGNKINPVYMDDLFITDVFVVANQSDMLDLEAQRGDFAVRTDVGKTFVLKQSPATTLANWVELQTTSDVVSVNGKTGAVTIEISDLDGLQLALNSKVDVTTYEDEQQAQDTLIANKVDKVANKGLSTNDYTTTEKNKLAGIASGAEVNPYSKTQLDNMFDDKLDKNTDITAGTHPKITYDKKGLVTGGAALAATDIPNLNASKINAGEFDADRIPNLNASKINAGVFNVARIPDLAATKITQSSSNRFVSDAEKTYWDGKQDKLVAGDNIIIDENTNVISASGGGDGIDLNTLGYMNYSADIFYRVRKQSLFSNAWEHSLTVDPEEISENSTTSNARGKAQYPNGGTEGVIIPQGVTDIGSNAFRNWTTNNQPLVIPNSVTDIGFFAFYNWSSNKQPLVIPNSVTSIGTQAFGDWFLNNQPLIIPNSVTSIGINVFQNWTLVPYVEIQATTPPTLANANAFDNQNDAPIYVPDESVDDYKEATQWVDLADRIFSINDLASGGEKNRAIATKAEAEAGTINTKVMTPLRTKEAIAVATIDGGEW